MKTNSIILILCLDDECSAIYTFTNDEAGKKEAKTKFADMCKKNGEFSTSQIEEGWKENWITSESMDWTLSVHESD